MREYENVVLLFEQINFLLLRQQLLLKEKVGPVVKHIIEVLGSEEISESLVISEKGKAATIEQASKLQKSKDNSQELTFHSWIVALGIVSKGNFSDLACPGSLGREQHQHHSGRHQFQREKEDQEQEYSRHDAN
ncbi:hypothetical protein QOT17_023615 [Balamuthia mandrillaris]